MLPRIASLLDGGGRSPNERPEPLEARKRKLPTEPRDLHTYRPRAAAVQKPRANSPPVVMIMRQRTTEADEQEIRVCRPPPSPLDWDHDTPPSAPMRRLASNIPAVSSAMRRAVYRESRTRVRPTPAEIASRYLQPREPPRGRPRYDPAERRRLFYHHSIHPHKIHEINIPAEIPVASPYRETHPRLPSKTMRGAGNRFQPHAPPSSSYPAPAYYGRRVEEVDVAAPKRRRVMTSPPPPPRQPLYEPAYGLAILETSKPLMRTRYPPLASSSAEGRMAVSRQRYVRIDLNSMEEVHSPLAVGSRRGYSGSEGAMRTRAAEPDASPAPAPAPAPRSQAAAEKHDASPLSTLVLKSKEFLQSKSLVRNRHDEIDWVATFLKVGFDSSSIYALMCPLRKGRWKAEEESYTMGLLRLIESGTILLRHGQSIRGYIGEKLHSDDMRVLKKLSNCKRFHFAKQINPRLAEADKVDVSVQGAKEGLEQLDRLKSEFLRSVQLEALVAVRKYLSDSSLRDLLNVRA